MSRLGPRDPLPIALEPALSITDLLWVANTRHGPGGHWFARVTVDIADHDHLEQAAEAHAYLAAHHVALPNETITTRNLERLRSIREMVRGLLDPDRGWTTQALAILDASRYRVGSNRHIVAVGDGWDAFIPALLLPLFEVVEQRDLLRMCGNQHCRLIFLDQSKNRSRRWREDGGCGNRARQRRFRDSQPSSRTQGRAKVSKAEVDPAK